MPANFPLTLPKETVPTSVALGPDGAYYIGQLARFPLVVGAANVYRFEPGTAPQVFLTGFTFIIARQRRSPGLVGLRECGHHKISGQMH